MKVIVFGATGSAGGSVLRACLAAPEVSEVRAVVRRHVLRVAHQKLAVFVTDDFLDYHAIPAAFAGADACFFCLGVSATRVRNESEYRRITRDFAVAAATALKSASPAASFHFISGQGTRADSRFMWARVKAEAERDLIGLVRATCYRPAAIDGEPSDSAASWYGPLRPLFKLFAPFRGLYISGADLGHAMLQATAEDLHGVVLENAQIRDLADRYASAHRR
ncbi:MAG TPA: NAD(P)H-binding protein [Gemmatimonadaceae bacterium]|nr:NAD(P)H-binding protein [Gemmatimonadaceae bacterium]